MGAVEDRARRKAQERDEKLGLKPLGTSVRNYEQERSLQSGRQKLLQDNAPFKRGVVERFETLSNQLFPRAQRTKPLLEAARERVLNPNVGRLEREGMTTLSQDDYKRAMEADADLGRRIGAGVSSIGHSLAGTLPALRETAAQMFSNYMADQGNDELARLQSEFQAIASRRAYIIRAVRNGADQAQVERDAGLGTLAQLDAQLAQARAAMEGAKTHTPVGQDQFGQWSMQKSRELQYTATEGLSGPAKFVGDNLISVGTNLPAIAIGALNPPAGLTMMGTQAAAGRASELNARGIDPGEALFRGAGSGLIEAATEKIPLENMVDIIRGAGGASFIKSWLRQAGIEGAEESASYVMNYLVDQAVQDPESLWSWDELRDNALGGVFSGLLFGAGGYAINEFSRRDGESQHSHDRLNLVHSEITQERGRENHEQGQAYTPPIYTNSNRTAEEVSQGTTPQATNSLGLDISSIAAKLMVEENLDEGTAMSLAQSVASVVQGQEVSGNRAASIARSNGAVSALESATGANINRDAPLSQVKRDILSLGSRPAMGRTNAVAAHEAGSLQMVAQTMGKSGGAALTRLYDSATASQVPASEYAGDFLKYYNAGRNGTDIKTLQAGVLTAPQQQAAYFAGQVDMENGGNDYGQEGNLFVPGSSQWESSAGAGVQSGRVAEGPGRDQSGQDGWSGQGTGRRYDGVSGQLVSSASIGLSSGTNTTRNRVVSETEYSPEEQAIAKDNAKHGLKTVLVEGNLEVITANGEVRQARGAIQDGTIYVQTDHQRWTPTQINAHERFHAFAQENPAILKNIRDKLYEGIGRDEVNSIVLQYTADYSKVYSKNDIAATEEMLADAYAGMNVFEGFESLGDIQARMTPVVREAVESSKKPATQGGEDSAARFSLARMKDGTAFVEVNVDQHLFDGVPVRGMRKIANKVIQDAFRGKVIGAGYTAYVNKRSGEEYTSPANRRISDEVREAKMRTSPELDALMEASVFLENVPDDGRHPEATGGWDYLSTRFRVGGRLYEGRVSVMVTDRGRIFYDVTKIRDITGSKGDLAIETTAAASPSNISMNSIHDSAGESKTKFSLEDSQGRSLSTKQQEYFANSKVRDEDGNLLVVYHGTVSDFTVFDRNFSNPEGDMGSGFYFTNSYGDVDINYADENGADLQGKIERLAESLEAEEDLDYDEALERARAKYITAEPSVIEAYLNIENPVIIGGENETIFDFTEEYDEDADEYGEPDGLLYELMEALQEEVYEGDYSESEADTSPLMELAYEEPTASKVIQVIKEQVIPYIEDSEGRMVSNEVLRLAFERIGFDGIIDHTVSSKWGSSSNRVNKMVGVEDDTTHYIIFDSNQAKQTTNTEPTADHDIRFSLDDGPLQKVARELEAQNKALQQEVARFKQRSEYWRGQTRKTTEKTTDRKSVEKLARDIAKEYSSHVDIAEFTDALQVVGDYMLKGGPDLSYGQVKNMAIHAARKALDGSMMLVDHGEGETWRSIRDYLKNKPLSVSEEIQGDIADYNDFRKRNFGRMNLTNDKGLSVDVAYMELNELYGEGYFPSDIISPTDQLLQMADVLDGMRDIYGNPFASDMLQATEFLANDLIDRLLDLPQTASTFADKQDRKIKEVRAAGNRRLSEVRRVKNEQIAKIRENNRLKTLDAIQRERVKRDDKLAQLKDHFRRKEANQRDRRSATELRKKIISHVNALSQKLLKPTDTKHIPEELKSAVARMLSSINLESSYTIDPQTGERRWDSAGTPTKRTEAFLALKEAYTQIADLGWMVDPDLLGGDGGLGNIDLVIAMRDVRLGQMTISELETVWRTVRAVEASITNANRMLANERFETISELANAYKAHATDMKKKPKTTLMKSLDDLINLDMVAPINFLEQLGEAGESIWTEFRRAADRETTLKQRVASFAKELYGEMDTKAWTGKKAQMQTFELPGGEISLTPGQIMYLYAADKRKQARRHIYGDGIKQGTIKIGGKEHKGDSAIAVTEADVKLITESLSPEQKKVADQMVQFLSGEVAEWMNEQSMKLYGYKKFTETNYIPIRTDANSRKSAPSERSTDIEKALASKGFTKSTIDTAVNPLLVDDIFDIFYSHTNDATVYGAWLSALKDGDRFYDFQYREDGKRIGSVKEDIERSLGTGAKGYYEKLMRDLNGGSRADDASGFPGFLVRNYKAAAVGFNMRVVIQQPTAMLRAASMIDPKYLLQGIPKKSQEEMLTWAPIATWKDWGYTQFRSGKQMRQLVEGVEGTREKIIDKAMTPAGKADMITWSRLWNACKLETMDVKKDLKPGTDEFFRAVSERFTDIIYNTQVVDSILTRSQAMRSTDGLMNMATAFMSEPTRSFNMLRSSIMNAIHGKTPKVRMQARRKLARVMFSILAAEMVNALVTSLYDVLGNDDEDKSYLEKVWNIFSGIDGDEKNPWEAWNAFWSGNLGDAMNPLGKIYFVKDALSLFVSDYDVSCMDMAGVSDVVTAIKRLEKSLAGEGNRSTGYAFVDAVAKVANLAGVPASKLKRELERMTNMGIMALDFMKVDASLPEYLDTKIKVPMNEANKNTYIDMAFRFEQEGSTETAQKIYKDLMAAGITAKQIEDRKKSLQKKQNGDSYTADPTSYTDAAAGYRYTETEKKEPTGLAAMTNSQQMTYYKASESLYTNILDSAKTSGAFGRLDDATKDALIQTALGYAQEKAKVKALPGEYELDTKWMQWAGSGSFQGVDETEAILFKIARDMADGEKDSSGRTISGSVKEETLQTAREIMPWLTQRELDYLQSGFWKP